MFTDFACTIHTCSPQQKQVVPQDLKTIRDICYVKLKR